MPVLKTRCKAFGLTHPGRIRRTNEDAFFCDDAAGVFVVCDGMGGAAAGETASRIAAQNAGEALMETAAGGQLSHDRMLAAVDAANRAVFDKSNTDIRLEGMGTTLVTLALNGHHAWIAHVGDSRCYLLSAGGTHTGQERQLERLTVDHSVVEEQVRLGRMTRRQAERSPYAHVITRAVGTESAVTPDVLQVELHAGDVFLLASDGLTRELSDEAIAAALHRSASEREAVETLVKGANAAGGRDNITCVLVRIE